jgi:AcrR family transcriptional regulator
MGQREDLLAGAKQCLREKGYARTTARDITAASGASLAAIGYHFGSKEALLNAALIQANGEWGQELGRALTTDVPASEGSLERFERIWTRVVDLFATHRQLWIANFECFAQIDHAPEVRRSLTDGLKLARTGLAKLFHNIDASVDEQAARIVGSFYQALLIGVMQQWLIDPDSAPSGRDLAEALRLITAETGVSEQGD